MNLNCNNKSSCNTTPTTNKCSNSTGGGYAFVLVLFILIVLVGAAWIC